MFVNASPGTPESAFLIMNDPVKQQEEIRQLVKQGYLVRTRADANTVEARNMDYSRWEAALSSGAHFISTDYYLPAPFEDSDYQVIIPGDQIFITNSVNWPK